MFSVLANFGFKLSSIRRLGFAATHLPQELPRFWEQVTSFANDAFCSGSSTTQRVTTKDAQLWVENLMEMDSELFRTDASLFEELCTWSTKENNPLGCVLISKNCHCKVCGDKLLLKARESVRKIAVYDDKHGTYIGCHYIKFCRKPTCKFRQYYAKYSPDGIEIFYDDDWMGNKFFLSTQQTAFTMSFLKSFDAELLIGQLSYNQKANIYNAMYGYNRGLKKMSSSGKGGEDHVHQADSEETFSGKDNSANKTAEEILKESEQLDRRRLEHAHLQYALLQMIHFFPGSFILKKISFKNFSETITNLAPSLHEAFTVHYAGHSCTFPGCGRCLVLDGNMKNRRDVCMARDAGYISYEGLPGSIHTGCINSPAYNSRFCQDHAEFVCNLETASDEEEFACAAVECEEFSYGPITRARAKANGKIPDKEFVIEKIMDSKVTRSNTYYKVKYLGKSESEATWEPRKGISTVLIEGYQKRLETVVTVVGDNYNGQMSSTLKSAFQRGESSQPPVKKPKSSNNEIPQEGIFACKREATLSCKTEKDRDARQRKNDRSAGILCVMSPCGVITRWSELFCAESKTQVYAVLHDLLSRNENIFEALRYIIYDDGCHLKKFAQNPVRRDVTRTAKRLSELLILVDKMHMKGHVDQWCKENCDANNVEELKGMDTEVCEQTFSWLSKYAKMTRRMNRGHFVFFIIYVQHLHNLREEEKLRNSGYMASSNNDQS